MNSLPKKEQVWWFIDPGLAWGLAVTVDRKLVYSVSHARVTEKKGVKLTDIERLKVLSSRVLQEFAKVEEKWGIPCVVVCENQFVQPYHGGGDPRTKAAKTKGAMVTARCAQIVASWAWGSGVPYYEVAPRQWQRIHRLGRGVRRNKENLGRATRALAKIIMIDSLGWGAFESRVVRKRTHKDINQDEATAICIGEFWRQYCFTVKGFDRASNGDKTGLTWG